MKAKKRICIVNTVYTLFLYYLICGFNDEDLFIFSSGIPEPIRNNINHVYFPENRYVPITKENLKNKTINWKHVYSILKLRLILFIKTFNKNVEVYGHGHLYYSFPFYEYKNTYVIEDGLSNYVYVKKPKYNNSFKEKIKHFLGNLYVELSESYGTHKNIKKIYLTKKNVPEIVKDKVEVIDMIELWNKKTDEEQNKLLEIFNLKNVINELDENPTLLLTQSFNEDRLLPLDEQIEIYKKIINEQQNNNIIIKTHPRENKDYSKYFPNTKIIDNQFPLEILKCIDVKIKKIITLSSTSALHFVDYCEIEIYDVKTSSEVVNSHIQSLKEQLELQKTIMN